MNPSKPYRCLDQIGRGSYATVHKAIDQRTGEICAIKKINVVTEYNCQNIKSEISIMCECKCENIVRLIGSEVNEREVWLIMEYCPGGSVKDAMRELGRTIREEEMIVILKGVLTGLDYLHNNGKIHRDVKAANILLNEDGLAKLGDFGVSESLDLTTRNQKKVIGTLLWLAPEVLKQENYNQVLDIWSLGITIIEMGDGQPPYSELNQEEALARLADLSIRPPSFRDCSRWSQGLVEFLSLCLVKDSSYRSSAQKMLQHDIFKNSPPNDVLKNLVVEVCSTAKSNETQLKMRLDHLLTEIEVLRKTYREGIREVIKFDTLTTALSNKKSDFDRLDATLKDRDTKINQTRKLLESLRSDITKLERERNDLSATLRNHELRKSEILIELDKIRQQQKKLESESERRIGKLRSLEQRVD